MICFELNLLDRSDLSFNYGAFAIVNRSFLFEHGNDLFFYIKPMIGNRNGIIYKIDLCKSSCEKIKLSKFIKENNISNTNQFIKAKKYDIISFYERKRDAVTEFKKEYLSNFFEKPGVYNKVNKTVQFFDKIKNKKIIKHFVLNDGKTACFLSFNKKTFVVKFYFFDVEI